MAKNDSDCSSSFNNILAHAGGDTHIKHKNLRQINLSSPRQICFNVTCVIKKHAEATEVVVLGLHHFLEMNG